MRIAVLGASGRVGRLLVDQAGGRGHQVVALVREPDRFSPSSPAAQKVEVRRADVTDPRTFPDLGDLDVVVSTLGIRKADGPGALVAGARALAAGATVVHAPDLGNGPLSPRRGAVHLAEIVVAVGKA